MPVQTSNSFTRQKAQGLDYKSSRTEKSWQSGQKGNGQISTFTLQTSFPNCLEGVGEEEKGPAQQGQGGRRETGCSKPADL